MWYAYFKERIDGLVLKNRVSYIVSLVAASAVFGVSHMYRFVYFLVFWLCSVAFMFIILLVTMKIKLVIRCFLCSAGTFSASTFFNTYP